VAISIFVFVLSILTGSCAGVVGTPNSSPPPSAPTISISPSAPTVRAGGTQQFTAIVGGVSDPQLTWSVNTTVGGSPAVGTILSSGALTASYTAPASVLAPTTVTIKAAVTSNSSLNAAVTANLLNPVPQLSSISPSQLNVGSFTITVSGGSFVAGAIVNFGSTALATNFVSATELTASGIATASEVGNVQVTVTNPNPGSATSSSLSAEILSSTAEPPQISVSPNSVSVPTGGMASASLTVEGSPAPNVTCTVSGVGTAQLVGSILTYTAPNLVPAGGQSSVTCTASNATGSTTASVIANISAAIPGYVGPIPSAFFGMHIIEPADWPTYPIGALGKVTGVLWPDLEPTKGQFDWARLDQFVDLATAHGVSLTYSNVGVPPWAAADVSTCQQQPFFGVSCSGTVSNVQDWDDFVTALVIRYKGRIQVYELWNEPENTFTGTVDQLTVLTQHEHDVIRTIDPSAAILSPSMISDGFAYLDSYFAAGGTTEVDGVAFHAYPDPTNDIAETVTQSISMGIKNVLIKYGLSTVPLWDTEVSWGQQNGTITDPGLRAAFVAREYMLNWSIGVSRVYWYAWDSPDDGPLTNANGLPSEAGIAFGQISAWMIGATMTQPCSVNGAASAYHAVYTCQLTRSGGYQAMAVWNTDGSSTYAVPSQYLHYRDLAGNTQDIPADHQVTIGFKPILLEN
jgi:hypothetical protein